MSKSGGSILKSLFQSRKKGSLDGSASKTKKQYITFRLFLSGKTQNSHEDFIARLKKQVPLHEVDTADESDFILCFCPIVSRAGTDIKVAMETLHSISDTKPVVLVVLHHTLDRECVVSDSSKCVNRENTITVDCLFHESSGLLQCQKNKEALTKTLQYLKRIHEKLKGQVKGENLVGGESSSPHSPVSVPVAELRLVMLGRMGFGKSASGNTILGRKKKNQAATSTVTQQSESRQGEVSGRKVTVVDTPDWFSPELSLEKLRQDVGLCVHLSAPGPHAFLLVIPVMQSTGEERGMLEKLEEIFEERCWRNTMIIFSVTDELQRKNIEKFIQSGDQEVQRLVEKCGNRFHCLNIKESGDGSQVSELLKKIEKMVEGSREKFYSSDIYLETESQIRAMETKILKEREEQRKREEMDMKEKIEKEMQDTLRKIEGVIQEHEKDIKQLNDRTTELERKMKEEKKEKKKKEFEKELRQEEERRTKMEEKMKKLKEKGERERREMEERHRQEMEEIRKVYEGETMMEAERKIMKLILHELWKNILSLNIKKQEDFSRQMEEKNRELEILKEKLSELTDTHNVLEEIHEKKLRTGESCSEMKGIEGIISEI